ncbi:unnamed protein product [Rhizophagus irregularis]|uniref:Uncharacterized protein n=1 Tax=Rhizophagus irregularis TaxID=588596 RepID=A0A916EEL3_9GLOM|nr:unnamed protein product [Rhizophagus irregularis]CAB4484300.1 unnamed protein product [Rhizophagus irregularis]CAB4489167.1 unnamed protein product [Rhizophagus irregularis]CAB5196315.1 unnamed protein product [Rhizophagus irregularis]CAB5203110.1 unnamed protein product [Rhizophagus irregularis]
MQALNAFPNETVNPYHYRKQSALGLPFSILTLSRFDTNVIYYHVAKCLCCYPVPYKQKELCYFKFSQLSKKIQGAQWGEKKRDSQTDRCISSLLLENL